VAYFKVLCWHSNITGVWIVSSCSVVQVWVEELVNAMMVFLGREASCTMADSLPEVGLL
jgi:hypothetical protein